MKLDHFAGRSVSVPRSGRVISILPTARNAPSEPGLMSHGNLCRRPASQKRDHHLRRMRPSLRLPLGRRQLVPNRCDRGRRVGNMEIAQRNHADIKLQGIDARPKDALRLSTRQRFLDRQKQSDESVDTRFERVRYFAANRFSLAKIRIKSGFARTEMFFFCT
jgi:hypothetical protein